MHAHARERQGWHVKPIFLGWMAAGRHWRYDPETPLTGGLLEVGGATLGSLRYRFALRSCALRRHAIWMICGK